MSLPGRKPHWEYWNEPYEGLGGRGWYEGWADALHRPEGPFVGRGPRKYKRSDSQVEDDINDRLTQHGLIDATDIEVSVDDGEVTLRGFVDSRQARRLAEQIVDSVTGVKDIHNQLQIRRPQSSVA
jgi:osmotically-inducible protein OsmY